LREFITYDHRRILIIIEKTYLRPEGRGLSSMAGLGGSSNSSRGLGAVGVSSSSSMKN
jgi:hypothetical protein